MKTTPIITIRDMKHEDIEACNDIYFRAFSTISVLKDFTKASRYFSSFIEDKDKYAVCFMKDDEIIGFLAALQIPDMFYEYSVYIDNIAVDPKHQNKGYGSVAIKLFLDCFPHQTKKKLLTDINRPAYKMYLKLGFIDSYKEMDCCVMESSPIIDAIKHLKELQ